MGLKLVVNYELRWILSTSLMAGPKVITCLLACVIVANLQLHAFLEFHGHKYTIG